MVMYELNIPQLIMSYKYLDFESVQSAKRLRVLATIQSKENYFTKLYAEQWPRL